MALKSARDIEYKDLRISIRIQELAPGDLRPDEIDLIEEGLCADSISDIPLVGDFLGLAVQVYDKDKENFQTKSKMFKILSRYFSLAAMIDTNHPMFCNLVVEEVTDDVLKGKLMKD